MPGLVMTVGTCVRRAITSGANWHKSSLSFYQYVSQDHGLNIGDWNEMETSVVVGQRLWRHLYCLWSYIV